MNGNDVTTAIQSANTSSAQITSLNAFTASIFAYTASTNLTVADILAETASINNFSASVLTYTASINTITSSFATTGSNTFTGNQTVQGTLTAQTLIVQTITSSVSNITGSTKFGELSTNTHQFTGSMSVTGSLAVVTTGTEFQVTSTGVNLGNALTDNHIISGSTRINPNGLFISSSGQVGIGTITPKAFLEINSFNGNMRLYNASGVTNNHISTNMYWNGSSWSRDISAGMANIVIHPTAGIIFNTTGSTTSSDISERMRITADGLVGIGTGSPTYKFEVAGTTGTFSFNPNQASTMVIRGSVTGNFDINNEGASGVMRLYGTSIQLRTAALDPAVTITAAGGLQTNLSTISSYYNTPGNVASGGTTTFVYNQTSAEYTVGFEYCIVSLYAPSGTNLYGIAHGFVFFMADGATSASYISQTIANGWTVTHSATNAGVFTVTFTAGGGATHSNINIRTRKINRTNAG